MFLVWLAGLFLDMVTEKLGGFPNIFRIFKAALESIQQSRRKELVRALVSIIDVGIQELVFHFL